MNFLLVALSPLFFHVSSHTGVELNLGCPQRSARTEQFGAFLLERSHYQTIVEILSLAKSHLSIPVCAKIRLLPTLHLTIEFVRIIAPYIDVLTIHGRTRGFVEERRKGPADLEQIRLVFQAIRKDEKERNCHQTQSMTPDTSSSSSSSPATPTISATRRPLILWTNGNVRCDSDIQRNIDFTGADGAMIGEAALADPTIFERAVKTTTLSSSVYPTAEFSGEDSLLTLAEFDRKLAIMNEYVDLIQDTSLDYLSPFDSHADDRHRPSVSSSFDLLDDHPLVTWSIFHSHMYRLFNSDSRSRFLRFTQLQDEFLDCETLKDLRNILEEVRQRLVSERRFDFELQRKIEKERGKRQATRLGRQRKKLYQHATTTSMVNATNNADSHLQPNESHHTDPSKVLHMNSRERKRARWQERNREKKRQKVEQTDEEGKQLQVQQADVTPPPSVDTLHVEPEETNQPLPTNSNSNVSGAI